MVNTFERELKEHFEERLMRNLTDQEKAFVTWVAEQTSTQQSNHLFCEK